ncbi:MAG: Sec-independent protein translocase subunit TatA/TatB, partial [Chitinophagaceae bacterium]
MGPLGFNEILLLLLMVLLLFEAKKIPELMRGVGKGMREFTDAKNQAQREMDAELNERESKVDTKAGQVTPDSSGSVNPEVKN